MVNNNRFSHTLGQLYGLIQRGESQLALTHINKLLQKVPNEENLLHLSALAYESDKRFDLAVEFFHKSLAVNPKQVQVLNNCANLYAKIGQGSEAEIHYKKALAYDPNNADALKNYGLYLIENKAFEVALSLLNKAIVARPNDVSILTAIGNAYRFQEQDEKAEAYYLRALEIDTNHVNAMNNLGLVYKERHLYDQAIVYFKRAKALKLEAPEIDYNMGNVYFELGRFVDSERCFKAAIKCNPGYIEAHKTLNELYWQQGEKQKFCSSYREALNFQKNNDTLRVAYVNTLLAANRLEEAYNVIDAAPFHESSLSLNFLKARVLDKLGHGDSACDIYEEGLLLGFDKALALEYVKLLIPRGQLEKAHKLLDAVLSDDNFNQTALALKGVCWRIEGDEKYHWLNDCDAFVKVYTIEPPSGYSSLNAFLDELKSVVLEMHRTKCEPLFQSLKNGTQTPGRFLQRKHPIIPLLKNSFEQVISDYIGSLQDDCDHPFLVRKSSRFHISGSWSVKLVPGGFHVNHIHPAGWISSSFYLHLPDSAGSLDPMEGRLVFGVCPLTGIDCNSEEKVVEPSAGSLVLFPSYFWHGTRTFSGDSHAYRMTTPFDVIPL